MTIGMGLMRLAPRDFWAMTPRELAAAMGQPDGPMRREALDQLMKEFPDG